MKQRIASLATEAILSFFGTSGFRIEPRIQTCNREPTTEKIMTIRSLDPRVTRMEIPEGELEFTPLEPLDQHPTWEVFHQAKRGEHSVHVGSLHAPDADIALVLAKEQYGRRSRTVSLWVVPTSAITTITVEDADIFETVPEKDYREAKGYRVGVKLKAWKKRVNDEE